MKIEFCPLCNHRFVVPRNKVSLKNSLDVPYCLDFYLCRCGLAMVIERYREYSFHPICTKPLNYRGYQMFVEYASERPRQEVKEMFDRQIFLGLDK